VFLLLIVFICLIALGLIFAYLWLIYRFLDRRANFAALAFFLLPFIAHEAYQYHSFSKVIPDQIGITYPVSTSTKLGCATIVFKVSEDTLAAIKHDGLKFFNMATSGRGYPGDRYYQYANWKETPLPPSWTSEGSWMGCSGLSYSENSKIVAAAKLRGAYYTTKDEGELVLIPSIGYVIFTFFD
jgi:hypothetical protein